MKGIALAALLLATMAHAQRARSVSAIANEPQLSESFDSSQSAALFVGVRQFTDDKTLSEVRYAVDDAIDLAFVFALDVKVRLVEPGRVILALSGNPQKPESEQHLNALKAAGVIVRKATHTEILALLEQQAAAVGSGGLLIVAFATHGLTDAGNQYLIASDSLLRHRETSITEGKIRDMASQSDAARTLIFLDACRERLTAHTRAGDSDPRSAASLVRAMEGIHGQVILSAASEGKWAYDDDQRRNGVFTAAVVDGLRCAAAADRRGLITVQSLATYVNERVKTWVQKYRDPNAVEGIQKLIDGGAETMPLSVCGVGDAKADPMPKGAQQPASVRVTESSFQVFDHAGMRLWGGKARGRISRAEAADLDGDGTNEVLVSLDGGADSGRIMAFDRKGVALWSADTTTTYNYAGGSSGKMAVITFVTSDLFGRGKRQVVALSIDAQGWYQSVLSIIDSNGKLLATYWHPGHLQKVAVGSATFGGEPRIVVGAVNNDLRPLLHTESYVASVFMLNPKNVRGEAPPYAGGVGRGTQLWYGVILSTAQNIERLEVNDLDRDGTNEIMVWTSTATMLHLDFDGRVVARARGDGARGTSDFHLLVESPQN